MFLSFLFTISLKNFFLLFSHINVFLYILLLQFCIFIIFKYLYFLNTFSTFLEVFTQFITIVLFCISRGYIDCSLRPSLSMVYPKLPSFVSAPIIQLRNLVFHHWFLYFFALLLISLPYPWWTFILLHILYRIIGSTSHNNFLNPLYHPNFFFESMSPARIGSCRLPTQKRGLHRKFFQDPSLL